MKTDLEQQMAEAVAWGLRGFLIGDRVKYVDQHGVVDHIGLVTRVLPSHMTTSVYLSVSFSNPHSSGRYTREDDAERFIHAD